MAWQRVDLVVAGDRADALAAALEEAGAISIDLSDADAGTEPSARSSASPAPRPPAGRAAA